MNTLFPPDLGRYTRREFFHLAQKGLMGLFLLPLAERAEGRERIVPLNAASQPRMGRALDDQLSVFDQPSFTSNLVNMYWRDLVFPIQGVTIGDEQPEHNRVWYRLEDGGYAHSGQVQPVDVRLNPSLERVPEKGLLAEVTVPFTDAVRHPDQPARPVYRLYYSSLHWIIAAEIDREQRTWYLIKDDKYKIKYYVQAEHLRPLTEDDLAPLSPDTPAEEKRLEVRLAEQVVLAYEAERVVFMARLSSGARFARGDFTTPAGYFVTNRKRPSRHMASGDLAAPDSYDLPGVPWVSYLTLSGISFHGTYWHNDFGRPRSHGCLNLSPDAARWIYRWTTPRVPFANRTYAERFGTFTEVAAG